MQRYIYKILDTDLWKSAEKKGVFEGAGIDLVDGYIHFSDANQAQDTARLHFSGQENLSLLQIDTKDLEIIWEPSRGGQLFPHLYGSLPVEHVTKIWLLPMGDDGFHELPDLKVYSD